ncbi:Sas10 C-terminal domain-containing protein [Fomitopsis serialis]|uniref:Sas10 C-terminal domain-containing protein n=1 Tax=Fomitopsis serialis TaxID=139415 RepID=UPI002008924B|nr:Sas10 C-terminal domain-containing protein [Neoantrodia serialis]KAH9936644.1 Sas10 C-terminal domain-containing protein [Neoantrodia serialis]
MARKRGTGKAKGSRPKPRGVNPKESKIAKWDKPLDIPLDEEDQFHTSRDKILGGDGEDDEDEGDEDEVFALKGMSEGSDEDENADEEDVDDQDHIGELSGGSKSDHKAKGKKGKAMKSPSASGDEEDEEEEGWGKKKAAYYSSNAAQIESEDEEANELEEQEAKRLQVKARETMADDDFGLGDPIETAAEADEMILDVPPPVLQYLPTDKQSLVRHLEKNNPEALALARDWDDTAHKVMETQSKLSSLETSVPDALSSGMSHLYYQALLTYATTVAFYLHLRTSEKYVQRPDLLRTHPILQRLLSLKQAMSSLEDLNLALDEEDEDDSLSHDDDMKDAKALWLEEQLSSLEPDELRALLKEADSLAKDAQGESSAKRRSKASSQKSEEPPKKKRKTSKASGESKPATPVFDLVEPDIAQSKPVASSSRSGPSSTDVYGEATSLQAADAADKQARKKSLRFHAARIENTNARRQNARSNAMGGDDDIPYRERKKAKEARLAREVAKGRGEGGDDLDDAEPEPRRRDKKRARDEDSDSDGGDGDADGYYELVQRKSKERKEKKKAEYEAAKAAERPDIDESADGPRALTRAILKNKGLTPHRGKSVRNPRVKKRQKYEKAKKKVSSQKAVYKGGISDTGHYDGEKSGISRVVKSVRL